MAIAMDRYPGGYGKGTSVPTDPFAESGDQRKACPAPTDGVELPATWPRSLMPAAALRYGETPKSTTFPIEPLGASGVQRNAKLLLVPATCPKLLMPAALPVAICVTAYLPGGAGKLCAVN